MSVRAVAYMKGLHNCPNGEIITRTEKWVGVVVADAHQDRAGARTFPAVSEMMVDAMVSESTFYRLLDSLERKGVIRRQYPQGRGRGKTTFYFFPELDDEPALGKPAAAKQEVKQQDNFKKRVPETCQNDSLFLRENLSETCHKPVKSRAPIDNVNKSNKSKSNLPLPLPREEGERAKEAALERSVDAVMHGCGLLKDRLRPVFAKVLKRELDSGKELAAVSLAMIAAWKEFQIAELRFRWGIKNFFLEGHWKKTESWPWDHQRLERLRDARVGMQ